ncbi:hypothetical protein QUB63_32340 [Microcoleus sp. ARI1-B5]
MPLVKSHSFSVWSDEAEIALSREGVMATAQTSPFCPHLRLQLARTQRAIDPTTPRRRAAFTALLHWFGVFLNEAASGLKGKEGAIASEERDNSNPVK